MVVGGGLRVVVEVVDNEACSLGWDVDIKLEKNGVQGSRNGCRGTQSEQNISAGVDEVEDLFRRQVRAEAWCITCVSLFICMMLEGMGFTFGLGWEEDDLVIGSFAQVLQCEVGLLRSGMADLVASACVNN